MARKSESKGKKSSAHFRKRTGAKAGASSAPEHRELREPTPVMLSDVLPLPEPKFQGNIGTYYSDSAADIPKIQPAPPGAPNVLLILLDDVGFGHTSTFVGPVNTPTLQQLADTGLRYNRFHTTALCSPSRAALLSGREHFRVQASTPLPEGEVIVTMRWEKTGDFAGRVTLLQNKNEVGKGDVPRSNPVAYAASEGLEIGADSTIPTWPGYQAPFSFTGKIERVVLDTTGPRYVDPEGEARRALLHQ